MSLFKAPVQVINKLEAIRSHFFHDVDPSVRKMMLVKWNNVLASKEMGGLGVSSFHALNRALIFKWVWKFRTQGISIWTKVIKALHGEKGNLDWPTTAKFPSNWLDIIRSFSNLYNKGADLLGSIKKKVGNGENTMFWDELWKGEIEIFLIDVFRVMKFDGGVKGVFGFVKNGGGGGGIGMDVVGDVLLEESALFEDDGVDGVKDCDVKGEE
nr:RNA-directed DNA polymerase, eukaryota, reverse transcriptase zinc-binding domain protein [Tanacetum cinerariifolium]